MEYYIITDISENYNYINDLACRCKMEIIDYLKYSIMTSFNIDIQNIKVIDNNITIEIVNVEQNVNWVMSLWVFESLSL